MVKSSLAVLALSPLLLVSCSFGQNSEDKLVSVVSEMACLGQFSANALKEATGSGTNFNMQDFQQKRAEMSKNLSELQKSLFEKQENMKAAYAGLADRVAFKMKALEAAKSKCAAEETALDKVTGEIEKDVDSSK